MISINPILFFFSRKLPEVINLIQCFSAIYDNGFFKLIEILGLVGCTIQIRYPIRCGRSYPTQMTSVLKICMVLQKTDI
jgi:hypothetical protein